MDHYSQFPGREGALGDRMNSLWERGLRIARRLAVAFGLSTILGIWVGAAVTSNAFAQIFVTVLAAVGLWLPMLVLIVSVENFFGRWCRRPANATTIDVTATPVPGDQWLRLTALAPEQHDRVTAIRRSLERSRQSLGSAELDPGARDLCVLIDRRLPELIEHQLDSLPPDDRGRDRQIGELIDLVEQFARHCGRKRDGETPESTYQAEILRRRFEEQLGDGAFKIQ